MVFIYDARAKDELLIVENEIYHYLFRVRRHVVNDVLIFANLQDSRHYYYEILSIDKKVAHLKLLKFEEILTNREPLHLAWCMIDPKVVEKTLPMLNELGVTQLTLLYCNRSQANFRIALDKIEKIIISSSQQCGRIDPMKVTIGGTLETFLAANPQTVVVDFDGDVGICYGKTSPYLIGCEGGFTQNEREKMVHLKKVSFKGKEVLRSETVVVAIASKFAL